MTWTPFSYNITYHWHRLIFLYNITYHWHRPLFLYSITYHWHRPLFPGVPSGPVSVSHPSPEDLEFLHCKFHNRRHEVKIWCFQLQRLFQRYDQMLWKGNNTLLCLVVGAKCAKNSWLAKTKITQLFIKIVAF